MAIDSKYGRVVFFDETGEVHQSPQPVGWSEPVFVIRAQDKLAPSILFEYLERCIGADVPAAQIARLHREIARFMEWQEANPTRTPNTTEVPK